MRLRLPLALMPLLPLLPATLIACTDFTLVGEPGGDGAPTALLVVAHADGQAPFDVVLDASGSTPFKDGDALEFDFDADGDGTFEVERQADATFATTYTTAGTFKAAVRVRGLDGRFDVDTVTIEVLPENAPRTADIDVDSDNDGVITGADEVAEAASAAIFLANVDDDNRDGSRDRQDRVRDANDDDLTEVIVRRVRGLDGAKVFIAMSRGVAADRVSLWAGDVAVLTVGKNKAEVPGADAGDVTLLLEAQTGRTSDWDGEVALTVTVEDGGTVISEDTVTLRAAPVIFPDNLQRPKQLFVMNVRSGGDNNQALLGAFRSLPNDVDLYTTLDDDYFYDRWMQDNWEVGSQTMPTKDGVKEMITAMQLERSYGGQGLDSFVPFEWTGPDRGYLYPSGAESSHNYGGNLEVAPPTAQHPFGRMIYGGGTTTLSGARNVDTMNDNQVSFLDAQEIQGPALEVSSEWLAVGHIDEIFQFVPDLTPNGPHPFKVVIASPAMAREVLLGMRQRGQGSARIFAGRAASYSVDQVLDAEEFNALNEAAQIRIDGVQADLKAALGLTDDDFRPVPVMFDEIDSGLVAAFNPGIQNLVTIGDRVFAPDPSGPIENGVDVWQQATLESLADTDLDVIFVDVFESYHELLGEAHCGTNVEREHYAANWWGAP